MVSTRGSARKEAGPQSTTNGQNTDPGRGQSADPPFPSIIRSDDREPKVTKKKKGPPRLDPKPRRYAVALTVLVTAITYSLKTAGTLDAITADTYISALRYPLGVDVKAVVKMQEEGNFPSLSQIAPAVYVCTCLTVLRVVFTDMIFTPIANSMMTLDTARRPQISKVIVEKFVESSWRFTLYLTSAFIGVCAVWGKPWLPFFGSTKACWAEWPTQAVDAETTMLYLYGIGMYLHLLFFQFVDIRRKDFSEMLIHHIATLVLMFLSYLINFCRIGSLVMLIHDPTDVFLEAAKIFNYIHTYGTRPWAGVLADVLFYIFSISFVISRLVIFPLWILKSTIYESKEAFDVEFGLSPAYFVFNGLLILLQLLHLFWCSLLLGALWKKFTAGELHDHREDDDRKTEEPSSPRS